MEQKMHKRILSFIEEERLLSGDERICVDIFRRLKKNRSYLPSLHAVVELAKSFNSWDSAIFPTARMKTST